MNRTGASSRWVTTKQACNLIDGANFAYECGFPLNRSISFDLNGLETRGQLFLGQFLKHCGDWLRMNHSPWTWAWVLENPLGGVLNAHIILHCPENLKRRFRLKENKWARLSGLPIKRKTKQSQKIGIRPGTRDRVLSDGEYLVHLERYVGYLLKGAKDAICDDLVIDHIPQGIVVGKRVAVSESISWKARTSSGFVVPLSNRVARIFPWRHRLGGGDSFEPEL